MDWIIAIPSHGRSKSIRQNTLRVLNENQVPSNLIKVFVAPEEVATYRECVPGQIEVIPSALGCIENRAFIQAYYPEGQHIVYLDDDLQGIYSVCDQTENHVSCPMMNKSAFGQEGYKKQMALPDLCRFLSGAFTTLQKESCHFGGVYPIANGYFATHKVTTDLRYICGNCYFVINQHDFQLDYYPHAEDMERTIKYFIRDGKVICFNYVMVKSGYYKGSGDDGGFGGLAESRTVEKTRIAMEKLQEVYPGYCKVKPPTKGNRYWNLTLFKKPHQGQGSSPADSSNTLSKP